MKMFRVVVNGSEYKVGIEELKEDHGPQPVQPKAAPPSRQTQPSPAPKPQPTAGAPMRDLLVV